LRAPAHYRCQRRDRCRICGGRNLDLYLDLGDQPPSNGFIEPAHVAQEQRFPLQVVLCRDCGLSQLRDVVSAEDIFDDYLYLSSKSNALLAHYATLVADAVARFRPADGSLMVDVGCNDGVLLKGYPAGRFRLLGIEPSSAGDYARKAGFAVESAFFNLAAARRLREFHGAAAVITATNVFAHVDDIVSFARGIEALLADDGVYITEFPYLRDMIERSYFDTVYHEHLSYLALTPLKRLFDDVGLRAFRVERTEIGASGPAFRVFVGRVDACYRLEESVTAMLADEQAWGIDDPSRYREFAGRVAELKSKIMSIVVGLNRRGHKVGAFSAPAKGNTLLNYVGLGPKHIVSVSENNELKIGRLTPGSHIPIVSDGEFLSSGVSHALLLSWNYLDFFLGNTEFIKRGGKFIVPLPEPRIVP